MVNIELFATIMLVVQIVHSIEELLTGFYKKWFVFKMSFKFFLGFEIIHNLFWVFVLLNKQFPFRTSLLTFFIILMFAQSILHMFWMWNEKKYIPGLYTAILHIIIFPVFCFLQYFK